jgi:hypothetical protein
MWFGGLGYEMVRQLIIFLPSLAYHIELISYLPLGTKKRPNSPKLSETAMCLPFSYVNFNNYLPISFCTELICKTASGGQLFFRGLPCKSGKCVCRLKAGIAFAVLTSFFLEIQNHLLLSGSELFIVTIVLKKVTNNWQTLS